MEKKLLLLVVVLGFCITPASSQDTATQRILAAKDDSAKVIQLANHAYAVADTSKEKGLKLYAELMRLSKKLNYPYWVGMTWFNTGYIHAREAEDAESIKHFDSALVYLRRTNRLDMTADCHLNIASLAGRMGNTDLKLKHLNETIRLLEGTKYTEQLNRTYNSLGVLFYNLDNYHKGLSYFQLADRSARATKDTANLVEAKLGIVNCLSSQEKYTEAERYGKELLGIATASGKNYNLQQAHTALSELYRKWRKAQLTIAHSKKVMDYSVAGKNVQYQLIGLMGLADGYALAGDFSKSIIFYHQALMLGQDNGTVIQLDDIYKGLSDAYVQTGQPGKALDFYKKYVAYRDSANNEKVRKYSEELDVKYQAARKEKALSENLLQLARKDLQIQRNRNYMYYSIVALILALLIVVLLFLRARYRKFLHSKELKRLEQERELQLLQALMQGEEQERSRIARDLHDGVAGMLAATKMHLSSIPGSELFFETDGYRQGMLLLNEATREIRKTSHNLMPELLLTKGLDEALRWYCANITGGKLFVQYDSWGELKRYNGSFELSVYRIVQELLNNIIKHSKATQAIVQMSVNGSALSITVEDNGIGFSSQKFEGMGIKSVKSRISALNGKMEMETGPGNGVSAYLEFDTTGLEVTGRMPVS